jgi:hypothetical protein
MVGFMLMALQTSLFLSPQGYERGVKKQHQIKITEFRVDDIFVVGRRFSRTSYIQ